MVDTKKLVSWLDKHEKANGQYSYKSDKYFLVGNAISIWSVEQNRDTLHLVPIEENVTHKIAESGKLESVRLSFSELWENTTNEKGTCLEVTRHLYEKWEGWNKVGALYRKLATEEGQGVYVDKKALDCLSLNVERLRDYQYTLVQERVIVIWRWVSSTGVDYKTTKTLEPVGLIMKVILKEDR